MAKQFALNKTFEAQLISLDKHVKMYAVPASQAKSKNVSVTICKYFTQVNPILDVVAQVVGAKVGNYIKALQAGLTAYCAAPDGISKASSIDGLCKLWAKVAPIVGTVILIFGRAGWGQALKGFAAALNQLCPQA